MNVFDLPPVNATLNGLSTCFIAAGWIAIRRDRKRTHITCMITALICSTVFLACYLTYHFGLLSAVGEGSVRFTTEGWVRPLYYVILITHLILAFTILPLGIITVIPALLARFDRHARCQARGRQSARRALPARLMGRRPRKVAAVALANKMARIAWALMARGERYRVPKIVTAAA